MADIHPHTVSHPAVNLSCHYDDDDRIDHYDDDVDHYDDDDNDRDDDDESINRSCLLNN